MSVGIIGLSLLWISQGLGILPDSKTYRLDRRVELTESIALTASVMLESKDNEKLQEALDRIVERNSDIVTAGFRRTNGTLDVWTRGHDQLSNDFEEYEATNDAMKVAMLVKGKRYGDLEVIFVTQSAFSRFLHDPNTKLIFFFGAAFILSAWVYLGRILKFLNPSKVVPNRVRSALDALSEGLFLLDAQNKIVMANRSICSVLDREPEDLQGMDPGEFSWKKGGRHLEDKELPWNRCRETNEVQKGQILSLQHLGQESRQFQVNANPILNPQKQCQGVLISFDDVTQLESKKEEMTKMLKVLRHSRDEIQRTNKTLLKLASSDPLTGCLNRRAFFEQFNKIWNSDSEKEICAIMIDLDHFKSINDNYGHATGDQVLREASERIRQMIKGKGLFCRYGGEEFSLVFSNIPVEAATKIAEKIRIQIESSPMDNVNVTASIGVASRSKGALDPQHLIDQADQCLYLAKRRGRNQVIRFDLCDREELQMAEAEDQSRKQEADEGPRTIHSHVVGGLLTALAYRDKDTALHSCRVANLCVAIGRDRMSKEDLYELEIAALMHDIGKIGVPDSILLKPARLTTDEIRIMKLHDKIGVNIVRAACASERVAEIIEQHHLDFYELRIQNGGDLPGLAARILPVCDSFDAMVSDRVYRKGMALDVVFEELRRVSSTQLDPEIVESLIHYVRNNSNWAYKPALAGNLSTKAMVQLGGMVERFAGACQAKDLGQLKQVASDLRQTADDENATFMADAASRLETALSQTNADAEKLYDMASEVIDMCRSARDFLVDDSQAISRIVEVANQDPRNRHPK